MKQGKEPMGQGEPLKQGQGADGTGRAVETGPNMAPDGSESR